MPVTIGGSGPITGVTSINTTVSDTELGYLDGVSSALQTQINGKATYTDWTSYTPTLTTNGTNPNLGTGSTSSGKYTEAGKIVIVQFTIIFGSSPSAGTGEYRIATPSTPKADGQSRYNGTVFLYDASTTNMWLVASLLNSGNSFITMQGGAGTTLNAVAAGWPWTWAQNDAISGSFIYEKA